MGQPSAFLGADLAPPGPVPMLRLRLQLRRLPLAGCSQALEQVVLAPIHLVPAHFQTDMGQRLLLAAQHLQLPQILIPHTTLPWRNLTQLPSRCSGYPFQILAKSMSSSVSCVDVVVIPPLTNSLCVNSSSAPRLLTHKVVDSEGGDYRGLDSRVLPTLSPWVIQTQLYQMEVQSFRASWAQPLNL